MKTDNRSRVILSIGGALLSVMLMACWLGALPATADDDQDWLRLHEEVQEGKIKPLSEILDRLATALQESGLLVESVATGREADFLMSTEAYDAVVLDLGLPDGSGIQWLSAWREQGIDLPVLILTARERWSDKAAGFSAGADDYVVKPFETAEILFRLRALMRRAHGHAHPVIAVGDVSLDTHNAQVTRAGLPVSLTAQEFRLLSRLMHAAPRIVSRTELAEHVYDRDQEPDSNVIDVQVSRLRRKLGNEVIETVRGQGYRMVVEPREP